MPPINLEMGFLWPQVTCHPHDELWLVVERPSVSPDAPSLLSALSRNLESSTLPCLAQVLVALKFS